MEALDRKTIELHRRANSNTYYHWSIVGDIFLVIALVLGILSLSVSHRLFKLAETVCSIAGIIMLTIGVM
jgi:hypothetical protein